MKFKTLIALGLWSVVSVAQVVGQERRVEPRDLLEDARHELGLIDDLMIQGEASSTSYSVSTVNGVKTTRVVDPAIRMTIIEDPASGITCKVTKAYGLDDMAKIEEEQPELFMHLSAIPKTIGEAEVEVHVHVTNTYTAADDSELKAKHPEIHKLFKKYTSDDAMPRMHFRIGRPLDLAFPRMRPESDDDDSEEGDDLEDDDERDDEDGDDDGGDDGDDGRP